MYYEKDIISKWNSEMYDCNETDTNDVEFALSVIGVEPKRILEIACGSGRFLVPMANAGHNVTGLDFDEHMLNRISRKISNTQNIHWHKSDVINDEWGTGFDVVLLAANFLFNIVSDMDYRQAQELMIKKSAEALMPGGHVLIDYAYTFYPEKWFNNPNPNINFFILMHSFVKLELAYFFLCLRLMIAFITKQISNTTMVNAPYTKMLVYQGADCIAYSSGRVLKFQIT